MPYFVGIDISKFKHTCCITNHHGEILKKSFDFSNDPDGFKKLIEELKFLRNKKETYIGMEATGHYMKCLARFLERKSYKVQIFNPFSLHRFRECEEVNGAKTDKLDALLIARYLEKHTFAPFISISYTIEEIRKLSRAIYFLIADRTSTINHLHRYLDEVFPEFIPFMKKNNDGIEKKLSRNIFDYEAVRFLLKNYGTAKKMSLMKQETKEKIKKLSRGSFGYIKFDQLKDIAKNSIGLSGESDEFIIQELMNKLEETDKEIENLKAKLEPLVKSTNSPILSIKGLGTFLSGIILGEIGDFNRFQNGDQLIKYAGLDVKVYQSGTIERRGKLRKRGSPLLRYALILAVQKLRIHSSVFSEYYYSKIKEGKRVTVALTATSRKLLRVIWKMVTTNQVFNNL